MGNNVVDYKALGSRIQERRRQLGYSQQSASEKLNISTSFYSRVERGEKVASLETLIKITNLYKSSLDFLLQDSLSLSVSDEFHIKITQTFSSMNEEQSKRLLCWLNVISENIDRL